MSLTQKPRYDNQRQKVIAVARTWIGTPYRICAREIGIGVDCHQLVAAAYEAAGLYPHGHVVVPLTPTWHEAALYFRKEDPAFYPYNIMHQIDSPEPGDIALFEFYKSYMHAAIVTKWPMAIQTLRSVSECDILQGVFAHRKVKFLTPKVWDKNLKADIIQDKIIAAVRTVTQLPDRDVSLDTPMQEIVKDSIDQASLAFEIEEALSIEFSDEEAWSGIVTLGELVEKMRQLCSGQEAVT